jgi:ubiquinol-cytochrome c reductase cytochrome c subunit
MIRLAATTLAIASMSISAQQTPLLQPAASVHQGSSPRGERLFTGTTRLRNGGPACISCHTIAGTPFPGGGALGPDLTHAYRKLGPHGTQSAMQTLYFNVMTPIYSAHSLAPDEQADLMAFLQQAESRQEPQWQTGIVLLIALLLGGGFVALTGFLWCDRVKSVRQALVERATGQGARV